MQWSVDSTNIEIYSQVIVIARLDICFTHNNTLHNWPKGKIPLVHSQILLKLAWVVKLYLLPSTFHVLISVYVQIRCCHTLKTFSVVRHGTTGRCLQHLVSCYAGPFIGVVPTSVGANLASACGTPSVQVLSSRTIFLRNFHDHRNRFLPGMIDFAIRLMWLQITDVFMVHSLHFCKKLALLAYNWRSSGLTWEYLWSGCTHFICSTKL